MASRNSIFESLLLVLLVLLVLLGCPLAFSQVDYASATLKGTAFAPDGKAISGATVTATNARSGLSRICKTQADGEYLFMALPPATYRVNFEAPGFRKATAVSVVLTVGQNQVFDAHLQPGVSGDTVEISPDRIPLLQVEQSQQADSIDQRQVEYLPNINRSFTYAVYTIPGVTDSNAARSQNPGFTGSLTRGFSVGGGNALTSLSMIDGGENESGSGRDRIAVPLDAVQEFQVNRNAFAARFGPADGGVLSVVTKSGGDALHGDVFGYFRNQSLEAENFFNGLAGFPKAFSQNVDLGGTLGGPIVKSKLFFSTTYEFQRLDTPFISPLLGTAEAQGINGPGLGSNCAAQFAARIPDQVCYVNALKTSGNPFLVGFANGITPGLSPLNNPALATILSRNNGVFHNPDRFHNAVARFDLQASARDSLNLRFGYAHNDLASTQGGITNGTPDGYGVAVRDFSIFGNWTRVINSRLVNQALLQIVPRDRFEETALQNSSVNFSLGALGAPGPDGTSSFGAPALLPLRNRQQRYQFEDNVTWVRGAHTLTFGASSRLANYRVEDDLWLNPQFNFRDGVIPLTSLAPTAVQAQLAAFNLSHGLPANGPTTTNLSAAQSFAFGIPNDVIASFGNPVWIDSAQYYGLYAQDSWKVNSALTVNAGLRLDVDAEPSPLRTGHYASPRVGFAWAPFSNHKTIVRGGAGIYIAPVNVLIPAYGSLLSGTGRYINPVTSVLSPSDVRAAWLWQTGVAMGKLPFGNLTAADYAAVGIDTATPDATAGYSVASNFENARSIQTSLSVQRELARDLSLEVGYNMYHGVHLPAAVETGYAAIPVGSPLCPTPCTDPTGGPLYAPTSGQVQHTTYASTANSIYHGMTASLTKRFSHGLQFQSNYTWSKSIDDTMDFGSFQNWFQPGLPQRAVSPSDVRHLFVANAVYTTPFKTGQNKPISSILANITLSPVLMLRSGLPFSVLTPSLANKTNNQMLDSNYAMPFFASRDNNRGPGYYTLDLSLQKAFYLARERGVRMNVIAQGTNLLNRVNFTRVNNVFDVNGLSTAVPLPNGQTLNLLTGPYTGLSGVAPTNVSQLTQPLYFSQADQPRRLQFGLKAEF